MLWYCKEAEHLHHEPCRGSVMQVGKNSAVYPDTPSKIFILR